MFLLGFLCSVQPFQIVILIIFITIFLLKELHYFYFFHWRSYIVFIIYLGGLLILFLYFTSIIERHPQTLFFLPLISIILLRELFIFTEINKEVVYCKNRVRGVFVFSFPNSFIRLVYLFLLLFLLLLFISFFSRLSTPIRQN
jgi:NADH-ubiquinone oxidoreductase chain 6